MDITMDCFEGLEELFDQDITADYLAESFNTGPIKFENIFDDCQADEFDSLVAEDISSILDTEIQDTEIHEGSDSVWCKDDLEIYLENVLDGNNNTDKIDKMDCLFNLDDLDLEFGVACQFKQELKEFPENDNTVNNPLDFLNLPSSTSNKGQFTEYNNLFKIEHASKTVKQEKISQDRKDEKLFEWRRSPFYPNKQTAYQVCDLCPFKTKEKSIFRMHQSLVHKLNLTKCPKKTPQKPKIYKGIQRETISTTANGLENKIASRKSKFTKPSLESSLFPECAVTQNGNHVNKNEKTQHNSSVFTTAPVKTKEVNFPQANTNRVSYGAFPLSTNSVAAVKTNQVSSNGFPRNDSTNTSQVSYRTFPASAGYVTSIGQPSGKRMPSVIPRGGMPRIVPAKSNCTAGIIPLGGMLSIIPVKSNCTPSIIPRGGMPTKSNCTAGIIPRGGMPSIVPIKSNCTPNIILPSGMPSIVPIKSNCTPSIILPSGMPSIVPVKSNYTPSIILPSGMLSIVPVKSNLMPETANNNNMPSVVELSRRETTNSNNMRSIVKLAKGETTTSNQLLSANPGIARVTSCKIISPAPRKFVSILPKGPNCLINRFQQPNGKNPHRSNERLLRNRQERQRRNETKQALDTVKNLVPRLKFAGKPSQITILKETIKYVKYLQNVVQDDSEELEAQRKTFVKLHSKLEVYFQEVDLLNT